jgi:hypothetical protein
MGVTAVLIKHNRIEELELIIQNLKQYPFIKEILIRDNTVDNKITYGRYLEARKASNDIIYFQDDDCIVNNIEKLYRLFDGTKLVNGVKEARIKFYSGKNTLVGWGTFIKKEWLNVFDEYLKLYKEDRLLYREADRIFTSLIKVPRFTIEADVTDFPCAMSSTALSLQGEHFQTMDKALERVKEVNYVCQ